ncbi:MULTISPECIES: putative zinc-binding protein [Rheinheimera]|uniref:putative zinc-binding protein n=1 Tax=Rheinheimera TaxID=67575 RepID=UPI00105060B5|nr:putative zinc-binding protein [Rheinheimera sp. D18]QBL09717.1 zinc-binding protein [Rheinheimera sp. D18]
MNTEQHHKPLVYSCSGCSNVAQLANDLAVVLDREGSAEMSCIAGIGGNVKQLVKLAKSGRPILAVDGCALNCVKKTLATIDVVPTWHLELTSLGYKKREREDCGLAETYALMKMVHQDILAPMANPN